MMPRTFGIGTLVVTLAGVVVGPVSAQTNPPSVRVVNRAQILSRPAPDATVVSSAEIGTILTVLDGDGQWYWVALPVGAQNRTRGWVRAADVQAVNQNPPPAPASSILIPPTGDEIRAAQAQRELEQRQRQIEEQRIEKARQELEQRRQEYQAVTGTSPATSPAAAPAATSANATPGSSPRKPIQSDVRQYELFGGYAWLWDSSSSLSYPLGWVASVSRRLDDRWTIAGEVTGNYASSDAYGVISTSESIHTFTAGPRFAGHRAGPFTMFGQLLGGLAVERSSNTLGSSLSATGLALTPGFGADLPVARRVGMRIGGELGLLRTPLGWSSEFRMMTGLVLTHPQR